MTRIPELFFSVLLVSFFCLCVRGEAPPPPSPPSSRQGPPPAPLIYKAPHPSDLRKFTSTDRTFSAEFPNEPKVEVKDLGAASVRIYKVYRSGSNSSVSVTEYKEDLPVSADEAFRVIRQGILTEPRSLMDAESDFELNGVNGKEYRINLDLRYRIVRIFIVGRRVFEIQSDVTNWHIISDEVKDSWRKETDRFFSSFKILK
jgi:hypothetical protein